MKNTYFNHPQILTTSTATQLGAVLSSTPIKGYKDLAGRIEGRIADMLQDADLGTVRMRGSELLGGNIYGETDAEIAESIMDSTAMGAFLTDVRHNFEAVGTIELTNYFNGEDFKEKGNILVPIDENQMTQEDLKDLVQGMDIYTYLEELSGYADN